MGPGLPGTDILSIFVHGDRKPGTLILCIFVPGTPKAFPGDSKGAHFEDFRGYQVSLVPRPPNDLGEPTERLV